MISYYIEKFDAYPLGKYQRLSEIQLSSNQNPNRSFV